MNGGGGVSRLLQLRLSFTWQSERQIKLDIWFPTTKVYHLQHTVIHHGSVAGGLGGPDRKRSFCHGISICLVSYNKSSTIDVIAFLGLSHQLRKQTGLDGSIQCRSSIANLCCNEKQGQIVGNTAGATDLLLTYPEIKGSKSSCQQKSVLENKSSAFILKFI